METALIVLATIVGLTYALMTATLMITIIRFTKNPLGVNKKQMIEIYDELIDHALDGMPKIMKRSREVVEKMFEEDDL